MTRAKLSATTAVVVLFASTAANGESVTDATVEAVGFENRGYGEPLVPGGVGLDRSSVGYETIRQAANTNADVYGAIGAFDRYLRPSLDAFLRGEDSESASDGELFVFAFDHHQTYGVGRAIGLCSPGTQPAESVCDGQPRAYTADLYSTSIAAAWGSSSSGFFGSASYSLTVIPPIEGSDERAVQRGAFAFYLGLMTFAGMPAYRLLGKKVFNYLMPGSADGVLGGYTTVGPIRGYAGYVLSRGAFGDISVPRYSPFATAALTQDFNSVALLRGGLRDLDLGDALDSSGSYGQTALFAQRTMHPVPRADLAGASLDELSRNLVEVPVITGHFNQLDLAESFDLRLAVGTEPEVFLHEALISVHSGNFNRKRAAPVHGWREGSDTDFDWSLTAGTAALPSLYYYAVKGGNRFSFNAQVGYGPFSAFVRMNDPEFLQSFPFAYDALNAGIVLSGSDD